MSRMKPVSRDTIVPTAITALDRVTAAVGAPLTRGPRVPGRLPTSCLNHVDGAGGPVLGATGRAGLADSPDVSDHGSSEQQSAAADHDDQPDAAVVGDVHPQRDR